MGKKHKVIGALMLIGLPLLLFISAPTSVKPLNTKSTADATAAQPTSDLPSPDAASSASGSNATSTNQAATQPQTPPPQYNYTPVTPTIPTPKPSAPLAAPTFAPSAWTSTTGFLSGTYHYVVTYVSATGQETGASPASLGVSPNNQQVWVTNIPTSSDSGISERNLYRTLANSSTVGPYYLVTSFYDNVTTNYYDNTPDSVLSTGSPKYF